MKEPMFVDEIARRIDGRIRGEATLTQIKSILPKLK